MMKEENHWRDFEKMFKNFSPSNFRYAFFSEIRELSTSVKPQHYDLKYTDSHEMSNQYCECFFEGTAIIAFTPGGSRYIMPLFHEVIDIFPLEEGIIVKGHSPDGSLFSYLTINQHPLNDIAPLEIEIQGIFNQLIETNCELCFTSQLIPISVIYDPNEKIIRFCLLEANENHQGYLDSLDPKQRNKKHDKLKAFADIKLFSLYCLEEEEIPITILLTSGIKEETIVLFLLFKNQKVIQIFIKFPIENPKNANISLSTLQNIVDMTILKNQKNLDNISYNPPNLMKNVSANSYALMNRQKLLPSSLILLDKFGTVHYFAYGFEVANIVKGAPFYKKIIENDNLFITKIINSNNSTVTFRLSNNNQINIEFKLESSEWLLKNVFEMIRIILPEKLFITTLSDYIEYNLVLSNYPHHSLKSEFDIFLILIEHFINTKDDILNPNPSKKKRFDLSSIGENNIAGKPSWSLLLESDFHKNNQIFFDNIFGEEINKMQDNSQQNPLKQNNSYITQILLSCIKTDREQFFTYLETIFKTFHLFYEDISTNVKQKIYLEKIAELLLIIGLKLPNKYLTYIDYYIRFHNSLYKIYSSEIDNMISQNTVKNVQVFEEVPSLLNWASSVLGDKVEVKPFTSLFKNTQFIINIFRILGGLNALEYDNELNGTNFTLFLPRFDKSILINHKKMIKENATNCERVLELLSSDETTIEQIHEMPYAYSIWIYDVIRLLRENPQVLISFKWPNHIYTLVGREDIALNFTEAKQFSLKKEGSPGRSNILAEKLEEEREQNREVVESYFEGFDLSGKFEGKQVSKNKLFEVNKNITIAEYSFQNDLRFQEATHLLDSSKVIKINIEKLTKNGDVIMDDKQEGVRQQLLTKLVTRQLSKPIGRGALHFASITTLPTEIVTIPKIVISGQIVSQDQGHNSDQIVTLDQKEDNKIAELTNWPEFHNGVATGLRLAKEKRRGQNARNWILYQKPNSMKYEYGGFFLALGLLGYLDELQPDDVYKYLKNYHEGVSVGFLIGRSASKLGTMNDTIAKSLCLHIPYLLPSSYEIDFPITTQSAALLGSGLLYIKTSHRLMSEMMLSQIGRKPISDKCNDREVYSLSAGIALGLVNLGTMNRSQGLSDLQLNERLFRFIEGGKTMEIPVSMLSNSSANDASKCSSVLEGDNVNTHITTPSALMALTFIYLQSNIKSIADMIEIPSSFYSLEHAKPFHVLLKVICKSLIMWDTISSTHQWIESQIPHLILDIYQHSISYAIKNYSNCAPEEEIDFNSIALTYVNIVGGAILSIGLKFVGTGNKQAYNLIVEYMKRFKTMQIISKDVTYFPYNDSNKNAIDKHTLDDCLCICASAISLIMAGTCDIMCFRELRILRKRFQRDMNYGHNMILHMSIGFLFLGSGGHTFNQTKESIAFLLCSVYPYYPSSPNDNKYHLQAIRHLYVLAVSSKILQAKDVETGENIQVDIEIESKDGDFIRSDIVKTPALFLDFNNISKVRVHSTNYYDIELINVNSKHRNSFNFYLKKRPYVIPPLGVDKRTSDNPFDEPFKLSTSSGPQILSDSSSLASWKNSCTDNFIKKLINILCEEEGLVDLNYVEDSFLEAINSKEISLKIYNDIKETSKNVIHEINSFQLQSEKETRKIMQKVISECFLNGKMEVVGIHIWLLFISRFPMLIDPRGFRECRLILKYAANSKRYFSFNGQNSLIISHSFVSEIKRRLEEHFSFIFKHENEDLKNYITKGISNFSRTDQLNSNILRMFLNFLAYYNILNSFKIYKIAQTIKQIAVKTKLNLQTLAQIELISRMTLVEVGQNDIEEEVISLLSQNIAEIISAH